MNLRTVPGAGVIAQIRAADGKEHRLRVGRPQWIASDGRPEAIRLLAELKVTSGQRIDVEVDGKLTAIAMLNERLRASTEATLREFQRLGLPVLVLTGDTAERTAAWPGNSTARTSLVSPRISVWPSWKR